MFCIAQLVPVTPNVVRMPPPCTHAGAPCSYSVVTVSAIPGQLQPLRSE